MLLFQLEQCWCRCWIFGCNIVVVVVVVDHSFSFVVFFFNCISYSHTLWFILRCYKMILCIKYVLLAHDRASTKPKAEQQKKRKKHTKSKQNTREKLTTWWCTTTPVYSIAKRAPSKWCHLDFYLIELKEHKQIEKERERENKKKISWRILKVIRSLYVFLIVCCLIMFSFSSRNTLVHINKAKDEKKKKKSRDRKTKYKTRR